MSQSPDDVPKVIVGPILTWAVCGICALVFAASSTLGDLNTWDAVSALGYLPAARIWGGEYWALWTSVFVHFELWHIAFNLYWLWTLGRSLELTAGRASWAALFILSAGISSVAQMAVSGDTGVGASGVVYAFFGFMWAGRGRFVEFKELLARGISGVFFGWLLAGFLLTYLHILAVGNIAHLSGLVTGLLLGHAFYGVSRRKLSLVALPALCLAAIIPLFWAPWSLDWLGFKAVQAHSGERYLEAVDWYTTMLDKEPRNAWALYNRGVLFHELGMSAEADRDIGMALELDPNIAVPATDPGGH